MTNHERAEKIISFMRNCAVPDDTELLTLITAKLNEACRSAEQDGNIEGWHKGREVGFAAAKERAAEIVDKYVCPVEYDCCGESLDIAERIRAMVAEGDR